MLAALLLAQRCTADSRSGSAPLRGAGVGACRDREPGSSFGSGVVEERSPAYGLMPDVVLGVGFDL